MTVKRFWNERMSMLVCSGGPRLREDQQIGTIRDERQQGRVQPQPVSNLVVFFFSGDNTEIERISTRCLVAETLPMPPKWVDR